MTTQVERFVQSASGMRMYQQERSIMQVTELICKLMEKTNTNRAALADALGKSRSYVTQLLDGETNMTLRTLSDVFNALGYEHHHYASLVTIGQQQCEVPAVSQPCWNVDEWTPEFTTATETV